MKTDNIRIKRKNSDFLLYGCLYLLLVLVGIFLIGLPFLSIAPSSGASRVLLVLLGILCVGAGGAMYGLLLYRGLFPQDALIITNKGLTNHLVGGKEGVFIEWVNISSMKVFGLSKAPMLGLSLENNDSYLSLLDSRHAREARENLEVGLPIISIAQQDIFLPIGELKNLFSRMIKGAISWESYSTQGKKTGAATDTPANAPAEASAKPAAPQQPTQQPTAAASDTRVAPPPRKPKAEPSAFTPVKPASAASEAAGQAPAKPASEAESPRKKQELFLLETLLEDLDADAPKPAAQPEMPTPTVHTNTQEEIVLLDIDND